MVSTRHFALLAAVMLVAVATASAFRLTIAYTGEVRSNILPVDSSDTPCTMAAYTNPNTTGNCFGGYARRKALIDEIRANETNVLVLDPGNYFQGTLFYYKFRGMLDMELMADLSYDYVGLGIREFDFGISDLADAITNSGLSVLSCNLNVTGETKLRDIVQPYAIHTFGTDKVGIIGLISPNLFQQGSPGSTVSLMDTANSVAKAVEALREVKVENIILMSSWAREVEDLAFIATTAGVDIVVTNHATRYDSPLVVTGLTGRPVYVLSAGIYGKYLGVFTAEFDNEGLVANYTGSPIYVTAKRVPTPDSAIDAKVASANNEVEVFKMVDVGYNNYFLNASRDLCRFQECPMGNLITDSIRDKAKTDIAFLNAGSIRGNGIAVGNVTLSDLIDVNPFQNTIATFSLRGSVIPAVLINAVSRAENYTNSGTGRFLQVSGLKFSWNPALELANRVLSVKVLNKENGLYEDIRPNEIYTIAAPNFIATGGDEYSSISSNAIGLSLYGPSLDGVLLNYVQANSPLNYAAAEGRIVITDREGAVFERTLITISEEMKQVFLVITVVLCAVPVFFFSYLLIHRLHAAVVTASLLFCFVILAGSIMGYAGLIAFIVGFNDAGCMIFPWLTSSAFVVMYGALFSKTYRIYQIFRRTQKIRRQKLTNGLLLAIVGGIWGVEIVLLIVWTIVSPLKYTRYPDPNVDLLLDYQSCTSQWWLIFFGIGLGLKGLLLLWGMYLVWVTRKVDSDFREATYIGLSIYATFLASAVVIAVLFIVGNNPSVQFILTCLGVWIVTNAILLTLFVPKVIAIRSDPDNLWETYFKRRATHLSTRNASSLSLSYQSTSDSDTYGSIKEAVKNMSTKDKQQHLRLLTERREQVQIALEKLDEDIAWLTTDLNTASNTPGFDRRAAASPKTAKKPVASPDSSSSETSEEESDEKLAEKDSKRGSARSKRNSGKRNSSKKPEPDTESSSEEEEAVAESEPETEASSE